MASKKTLEKRGSISPISQLNSDGWRSLIYVIYYDPAIATEMTASKQTQLSDWISSGIRQKFTICNKQEVSAWVKIINKALENQKTNEACKEYKVASEGDSVSDLIMAKLVKAWLMNHKQETIEIKNNLKKEQALAESQGDKKNEKEVKGAPPPTAAAAKKPPNPKDPKKAPEPTPAPAPTSADSSKRKDKLRDRTGGKDRIQAIGDEPVDGPDMYYYLKDFDSPGIITALTEELEVPVDVIFRVEDPMVSAKKENATPNANWSVLNNRSKSVPASWRTTVWSSFQAAEFKEIKEIFEMLAKAIYKVVDRKSIYDQFYKGDRVITIPNFEEKSLDMPFYDYLLNIVDSSNIGMRTETIVAMVLEYLGRVTPTNEQIGMGNLKMFLDKEIGKLALDISEEKANLDEKVLQNTKVIESEDRIAVLAYCLDMLKNVDIDIQEVTQKLITASSFQNFVNFLDAFEEYQSLAKERVIGESIKLQTEFFKNVELDPDSDSSRLALLLSQIEFEEYCSRFVPPGQTINLDSWRWYGTLSRNSVIQTLEEAKSRKAQVYKQLSKFQGKLLVVLKSPGPIGCLEHVQSKETKVRTKIGFSMFHDLYDSQTNTMSGDAPNSTIERTGSAYEANNLIVVNETEKFMYPFYNTIIKVSQTSSLITGADTNTKVFFAENCISFAGDDQSKMGPYFTASFSDDCVFSIRKNEDGILAQFSVGKLHISLGDNGQIIVDGFSNSNSSKFTPAEVKRMYLPSGVIVKYFDNKHITALFPDGSIATQAPNKSWSIIDKNGEGDGLAKKYAQETQYPDGSVKIIREDFTIVEQSQDTTTVLHPDGIKIESHGSEKVNVSAPRDNLDVVFESNGTQTISIGSDFQVSRNVVDGRMTWIKIKRDQCDISIQPGGDISVLFSHIGYSAAIPEGLNTLNLNWIEGTTNFKDVLGYSFKVDSTGQTSVEKPEVAQPFPDISFGGKLLNAALKEKCTDGLIGNVPDLFLISANGLEGQQIKTDYDVLQYYQKNHLKFYRANELSGSSKSLTYSIVSQIQPEGLDSTIILYKQLTYYPTVPTKMKQEISTKYKNFLVDVSQRSQEVELTELGETFNAYKPETGSDQFTFGADKESTRLAIISNYMEQEQLEANPGINTNDNIERLLKQAKSVKVRNSNTLLSSKPNPETMAAKKLAKYARKESNAKQLKYFDSPEGTAFLQSQPQLSKPSSVAKERHSRSASKTLKEVPVPAEPIEEVVAPLPALPASTPPAQISKRTIPTIVEPEPVKVVKEKPVKKKERILKLPAAIMGAKPGSEPNVKHLAQEGDTKRKIKTVSTTASQNTVPVYGSSGFTVLPASASFGQVKAGTEHSVQLTITNIGMDSARYTIRQPKTPGINVRYKHGPIAPGMSAKLVISLNIQNPTDTLEIKDEFQLVSETEILHVPVKAIVSQ